MPSLRFLTAAAAAAIIAVVHADTCGTAGYSTNTDSYYYDDSGKQASFSACSQVCIKNTACRSFSTSSKTCELFNVAVAGNFEKDSSSPFTFYDRSCASAAPTTSSSRTSTSTSTSTRTSTSTTSRSSTSTTLRTSTTSTSSSTTARTSSTSTSTSTSASASSTGVVVPPGCDIPTRKTITAFSWFNSTHNLDCAASKPDVGDGTGCLDANGQWCDPKGNEATCNHCGVPVCATGLPPQPVGYGPPDKVSFTFSDSSSCQQANPQGFRNFEVGEGSFICGGPATTMSFVANSVPDRSTAVVGFSTPYSCSDGKSYRAYYNGSFPITCTRDAGRNATCSTSQSTINMPLVSLTGTG